MISNIISFSLIKGFQLSWKNEVRSLPRLFGTRERGSSQTLRALNISSSQTSDESADQEIALNNLVGEAVAQGLSHFGGDNVVESLVYILELEHSVNLKNVVNQVEELRTGLSKMFGEAAYVVEGHVCGNLAKTLGLDPEGRTLEELIQAARSYLEQKSESVAVL
jgi:hypothetical protein